MLETEATDSDDNIIDDTETIEDEMKPEITVNRTPEKSKGYLSPPCKQVN